MELTNPQKHFTTPRYCTAATFVVRSDDIYPADSWRQAYKHDVVVQLLARRSFQPNQPITWEECEQINFTQVYETEKNHVAGVSHAKHLGKRVSLVIDKNLRYNYFTNEGYDVVRQYLDIPVIWNALELDPTELQEDLDAEIGEADARADKTLKVLGWLAAAIAITAIVLALAQKL